MTIKRKMQGVLSCFLIMLLAACGGAEERKAKYMEKGVAYFEEGNYEKARIEFKNVLQIDPKYGEAYYYVGQLEERNKNMGKAIGNYKKALELTPKHVDAKIKLAKIFVVIGNQEYMDKAKKLIGEVLGSQSDNLEARLIGATITYKSGDKEKGIKEIEQVVSKDGSLMEGVSLLSAIYADQGNEDKAIKVLERGVKENPDSIQLKIALAKRYAENNKVDEAEKQILDIIRIEPDRYSFRIALFSLYSSTNQMEQAESVLRKAIEDDPEDVKRYLMLVEFISRNKSIKEAEKELKKVIETNPSKMDLRFALAEFYKKTGHIDDAKKVIGEILEKASSDKDETRANVELALIEFDERDYSKAREIIERVLEDHPNMNEALIVRGKIALINKDANTAVNDLRTVFKNEPKNPEAAMLLATAHGLAGQNSLAEDVLKKSIENNPIDANTHYNYARYLISNNKTAEAESVVEKALDYFKDSYELMDLKLRLVVQKGSEREIVMLLDKIKAGFPNRSDGYMKKGQYFMARKEYAKARDEFEQALTKTSDKYQVLDNIVNSYLAEQEPEKAIQRIQARLAKSGDDPVSYQLLGKIYFNQKDIPKAKQNFLRAIDVQKDWGLPYMNLASVYQAENNSEAAKEICLDAIANARNPGRARMQLATLLEKEGNYGGAIEQYRLLVKSDPSNMVAANNLASLLVENSPGDKAIIDALELTRDFEKMQQPVFLDTLGWVYVKAGKYPEAVSILRRVVEKAPDIAVFKYHLGVALNKQGSLEEGNKYLQEAVNSEQEFIGKDDAIKMLGS